MSEFKKKIISIEGNIGVGKSTFIEILKKKFPNCVVVNEPIDEWKNILDNDNKNILQKFYEDIPRWAYSFQNIACITRMIKMEDTIRTTTNEYIFLDRSLGTDANVFEKMLFDNNQISKIEHTMYNLWYDFYFKYIRNFDNIYHIYLKCSPEKCFERIKKRGRVEEESISIEYLTNLNKYHDEWLLNEELKNIVILDCEDEFELDSLKQDTMIQIIGDKLNELN